MVKVSLSPQASIQLREIHQYSVGQWGREKAAEYMAQFERCFGDLGENELLGRARPEVGAGYRSVAVGRHVVFYRVGDRKVTVVVVLHGNMDVVRRMREEKARRKERKNRNLPPKKK